MTAKRLTRCGAVVRSAGGLHGPGVRLPLPRQQFVQARDGKIGDAGEHIGELRLWVNVVETASRDGGGYGGGSIGPTLETGEGPVSTPEGLCPFILPISVRNWKFITVGIPILAARPVCGGKSIERRANFLRCKVHRVS